MGYLGKRRIRNRGGYLGIIYMCMILRPKANTIQCYDLTKQDSRYKNICYIILYTFLFA